MKDKIYLVQFLLNVAPQQISHIIKIMNKEQLQWIVEIIYNVVQGVCPISEADKSLLLKKKHLIRKLISKEVSRQQRKLYLLKINRVVPVFLKAYLHYVSRTDSDPQTEV